MEIILPPTALDGKEIEWPLFFLAGPIQGGGQWQQVAIGLLLERIKNFTVAVPGAESIDTNLFASRIRNDEQEKFPRQLLWERWYMQKASMGGCLIFWLPEESKTNPRVDGQPYARDSYGELGEWRGRLLHEKGLQVVIGAEQGFPGRSTIGSNYESALGCCFEMFNSLEETIDAAVLRVRDSHGRVFYDESRAPISCQYEKGFRFGLESPNHVPSFASLIRSIACSEEDDPRKSFRFGAADGANAFCKRR